MLLFQREILRFAEGISPLPSADPRQLVIRAKSTIVSPLECALTRRSPLSPLEWAVIKKGGRGGTLTSFLHRKKRRRFRRHTGDALQVVLPKAPRGRRFHLAGPKHADKFQRLAPPIPMACVVGDGR